MTDDAVTADALLKGRVRLYQPARGARMSLDPVLLAGFVAPPFGRFLDIGCGTGPLSFLLLARDPTAIGVGVEIQPRLAALAVRGRDDNRWETRLEIIDGDVRVLGERLGEGAFDLVVTNPPYRTVESSPPSPNQEKALAYNEIALRLAEWVGVAARAVRPGGRVAAILPAERAQELRLALGSDLLRPVRTRLVCPREGEPASRVLVEARRDRGEVPVIEQVTEEPLIVHGPDGSFTPEVRRMLGESVD
ncbi:MAG TPA: methyltransferase [Polyangia bacterium]|jgi:tRNA1(Val) A37 N6-methylase TrmN6|nr:methyltransferase [Polyangia bacterium]